MLDDTVDAIVRLRAEGKRVFVHCVAGANRTPAVAAAYLARHEGIPDAYRTALRTYASPC